MAFFLAADLALFFLADLAGLAAGWLSITDNFLAMTKVPETAAQGWIDATVTALLMISVVAILLDSVRRWLRAQGGVAPRVSAESTAG